MKRSSTAGGRPNGKSVSPKEQRPSIGLGGGAALVGGRFDLLLWAGALLRFTGGGIDVDRFERHALVVRGEGDEPLGSPVTFAFHSEQFALVWPEVLDALGVFDVG